MKPAVSIKDLTLAFQDQAVIDHVSFDIREGEFACLLGPSGCGKSTTLRLIGNLIEGYTGTISVFGKSPAETRSLCGYVFQSARLAPWLTARENVILGMRLRQCGDSRQDRREIADSMLSLVGLSDRAQAYPGSLSGGEKQRVAIARALAVRPKLLLMDEPLANLDIANRTTLRNHILRLRHELKSTIVFVTHDVEDVAALADHVVVLSPRPSRVVLDSELPKQADRKPSDAESIRAKLHGLLAGEETNRE